MANQAPHSYEQLRLLESWLPLAQAANERDGWGLDAATLEGLILAAAPALAGAESLVEAHAILWYHQLVRQARQL